MTKNTKIIVELYDNSRLHCNFVKNSFKGFYRFDN